MSRKKIHHGATEGTEGTEKKRGESLFARKCALKNLLRVLPFFSVAPWCIFSFSCLRVNQRAVEKSV